MPQPDEATAFTVTVTAALPARPPESVTDAVTTCVPSVRFVSRRLAPLPSGPVRLELQAIVAERSPSSVSSACAAKTIATPRTHSCRSRAP